MADVGMTITASGAGLYGVSLNQAAGVSVANGDWVTPSDFCLITGMLLLYTESGTGMTDIVIQIEGKSSVDTNPYVFSALGATSKPVISSIKPDTTGKFWIPMIALGANGILVGADTGGITAIRGAVTVVNGTSDAGDVLKLTFVGRRIPA